MPLPDKKGMWHNFLFVLVSSERLCKEHVMKKFSGKTIKPFFNPFK